jgi:hypothetical protein
VQIFGIISGAPSILANLYQNLSLHTIAIVLFCTIMFAVLLLNFTIVVFTLSNHLPIEPSRGFLLLPRKKSSFTIPSETARSILSHLPLHHQMIHDQLH